MALKQTHGTGDNFTTRVGDKIVRFVDWHWEEVGCAPSIRDIAAAVGIKSPSTALIVINNLVNMGYLERVGRRSEIKAIPGTDAYCRHRWRVENPEDELLNVICEHCGKKTQVEYVSDPRDPSTWLIYPGEA